MESIKICDKIKGALDSHSVDIYYGSGLALAAAVRRIDISPVERNPKGMPNKILRYMYHHHRYCDIMEYLSASRSLCKMKGLSSMKRSIVEKAVMK